MKITDLSAATHFEMLAEEANELATAVLKLGHGALKLARIERKENPTPVTYEEALQNFKSELADLMVCLSVLDETYLHLDLSEILSMADAKMERWAQRMEEAEHEN